MRIYFAILKCRLSQLFQYRTAALAGISTQIFWGLVKVMIMTAFFSSGSKAPITLVEAATFIWIGQALLSLLPWTIDKEIEEQIKNGNISYELVRPLELYWLLFYRSIAIRLVPTLMRACPLLLVASFLGLALPASWMAGASFVLSLFFSLFLAASMTTFVMVTLFWTISGEGILRLLPASAMLLSGLLIPLPLFPDWMQPFLSLQPFRGVVDIPSRIYTGIITDYPYYFAFQLVWGLLFILGGHLLLKRAVKRFVIQGG